MESRGSQAQASSSLFPMEPHRTCLFPLAKSYYHMYEMSCTRTAHLNLMSRVRINVSLYALSALFSRRRQWHPTPVLLPGKSHGQRSLVDCSPWGREESDTTERLPFHFHVLEKEMATHSSVLAWRISGTGEPGRLPSMGSHRVGHD